MKRVLKTVCAVVLSMGVLYLPAYAQSDKAENISAQDMLIKSEVETAVSMLQAVFLKHQKGEMSLEQARKLGADLLRELRYGVDGYFWADTTEGINVVLYGRKDTEGRKRIFYVKEFLATGTAGGGYVEYWFPKKGEAKAQAKRSYVLLFKPFGWVIGTGYYRK
jgi:methyl-accepting chemotaxis protein